MSKQRTENAHRRALEERLTHLEERLTFLEKQVAEHAHSLTSEAVLAIAAYVRHDLARAIAPPTQPQAEEEEPEQQEEQQVG